RPHRARHFQPSRSDFAPELKAEREQWQAQSRLRAIADELLVHGPIVWQEGYQPRLAAPFSSIAPSLHRLIVFIFSSYHIWKKPAVVAAAVGFLIFGEPFGSPVPQRPQPLDFPLRVGEIIR